MSKLKKFFNKELEYLKALTADQYKMISSVFYYSLAAPMISTFSNTYLWRQSKDPIVLAIFNIGFFIGLPVGFLINGILLRKNKPVYMYAMGCILQGMVPIALVFSGAQANGHALGLGIALGIAGGLYWGNKNLLTSELTVGPLRYKYMSLETIVGLACATIAPIITGWFLVLGERTGLYSIESAYRISALAGFALLVISARRVLKIQHVSTKIQHLFIPKVNKIWNKLRYFEFMNGFTNGIDVVVMFLAVLVFIKNEGSIGTLQAASAVLAALGMYLLGKRVKHKDHATILGWWTGLTIFSKAVFAWSFSAFGAIIIQTISGFVNAFRWASTSAVMLETIDAQPAHAKDARFAYLMDREFALDLGRVVAILLFIAAYNQWPTITLRYGLFATIFSQGILILLTPQLTKHIPHEDTTMDSGIQS